MINILVLLNILSTYHTQYISENGDNLILENNAIKVSVSKSTGTINSIVVRGSEVLHENCSIHIKNHESYATEKMFTIEKEDFYPEYASIRFSCKYDNEIIKYDYVIDTSALRWEVTVVNNASDTQEINIDLVLPMSTNLDEIFHCGLNKPLDRTEIDKMVLVYGQHLFLPMIAAYSTINNYGLSIITPLETPKPELLFSLGRENFVVSYRNLQLVSRKDINVALYVVPHEGDWRQGLNFLLQKYPEYFYAGIKNTKLDEGWYYLCSSCINEKKISELHERHVTWTELHEHFPFYGLYAPKPHEWGLIIDSDEVSIADWERGAGKERNGYKKVKDLINLFHKYGIRVYLYFQSAEAWHQYAEEYFADDIAKDRKGNPLPSWKFTNLMNPDPQSRWGAYIIQQAEKIIKRYPEIDGIFYDRMDYKDYDFAHSDGLTMVGGKPVYMLGFGQERINKRLFDIFHREKKGIWGNVPTSIEVCRNLDGIMAEKSLRNLLKLQYLGLARPIIYLPYDHLPYDTEEKLKNALVCGAFPAITYGGEKSQQLDEKYAPLFNIIYNREWVLTHRPFKIPKELKGNIFKTPSGDYALIITNLEKSQLPPHPFEYNIPVVVNIPDADDIKYAYLLSGDWYGLNIIDFQQNNNVITINLPYHLSTSLIYLTKERKFELARSSSPILVKGEDADMVFHINNFTPEDTGKLTLETPWFKQTKHIDSNTVKFSTKIPQGIDGEVEITVGYNGGKHRMSCWIVNPVSITPKDDIFVRFLDGDSISFYITNNLNKQHSTEIKGKYIEGIGTIKVPENILLQPLECRLVKLPIISKTAGVVQLTIISQKKEFRKSFPVKVALSSDKDDLFHDNFEDAMNKWTIHRGEWAVSKGISQGTGQAHFAYVRNNHWHDYLYEVTLRCGGSDNPIIDWLKLYIYFRLQDEQNFYRFGIHGDAGVIDIYKCIAGKWIQLSTSPFMPKIDKWYTLRIQVKDTKIIGYVDGMKVVEVDDGTFSTGGIGIGVLEDAMRCDYSSAIVKRL